MYVSMNQLYILLLSLWSAFYSTPVGEAAKHTSPDQSDVWRPDGHESWEVRKRYPWQIPDGGPGDYVRNHDVDDAFDYKGVPEPSITVYRQMEDGEHVIVLCTFATLLSVKSELKYNIKKLICSPVDSSLICVYMVTVSPPASFTCVQMIDFDVDVRNQHSQTYNYNKSVWDHREEGVSSLYICFSSFIAVGVFFMIAAVIVTNIRSKTKDTSSTAEA